MSMIDSTARIAKEANIGRDVSIGPYCVVGPNVVIADGVNLISHVHVTGHTTIGPRTVVYPFTSLGTPPQSVKYRGGPTRLVIGADCQIRETVTMNIGTENDRGVTEVGDNCFIMVGTHIAHDCHIGDNVTMANNVVLGGHVIVEDSVMFGGHTAVHQFVRIGEGAMVAGASGIEMDIIPYGMAIGARARLEGLNIIGLRRRGLPRSDIHQLRKAYQALFLAQGPFVERLSSVMREFESNPYVDKILAFIREERARPLMPAIRKGEAAERFVAAADTPA